MNLRGAFKWEEGMGLSVECLLQASRIDGVWTTVLITMITLLYDEVSNGVGKSNSIIFIVVSKRLVFHFRVKLAG